MYNLWNVCMYLCIYVENIWKIMANDKFEHSYEIKLHICIEWAINISFFSSSHKWFIFHNMERFGKIQKKNHVSNNESNVFFFNNKQTCN